MCPSFAHSAVVGTDGEDEVDVGLREGPIQKACIALVISLQFPASGSAPRGCGLGTGQAVPLESTFLGWQHPALTQPLVPRLLVWQGAHASAHPLRSLDALSRFHSFLPSGLPSAASPSPMCPMPHVGKKN